MIFAVVPVVGCAGSVQTEEADGFGLVASALWLRDAFFDQQSLLLTNVADTCGKLQEIYATKQAFDEAAARGADKSEEFCARMEEPTRAHYSALDDLYHEGAHSLTLYLPGPGGGEPIEQEYEVDGDPAVKGMLSYLTNSIHDVVADEYDVSSQGNNCVDTSDPVQESDVWRLADGVLDVTEVKAEESASGRFEGALEDESGDDAGEITVSFVARYCETG